MLGYHNHDRCIFDLWSPVDTNEWHPHQLETPDHPPATENRAFSSYAKHQQELEDIVTKILQKAAEGETNFSLDLDDDLSNEDLAYIQEAIQDRF